MINDLTNPDNNDESAITPEERALLDQTLFMNTQNPDAINLLHARLDNTDNDGEPLNELSSADDISGKDLDVPDENDDDENENIGDEDEENNIYSDAETE